MVNSRLLQSASCCSIVLHKFRSQHDDTKQQPRGQLGLVPPKICSNHSLRFGTLAQPSTLKSIIDDRINTNSSRSLSEQVRGLVLETKLLDPAAIQQGHRPSEHRRTFLHTLFSLGKVHPWFYHLPIVSCSVIDVLNVASKSKSDLWQNAANSTCTCDRQRISNDHESQKHLSLAVAHGNKHTMMKRRLPRQNLSDPKDDTTVREPPKKNEIGNI